MKIAVEEWELYNNGILLCKWFDTETDTIEAIERYVTEVKKGGSMNSDDIEMFIADFEGETLGLIHGDESVEEAYNVAEQIDPLSEDEITAITLMIEAGVVSNTHEAIEKLDDIHNTGETRMDDVAYNYVNECGLLENIPESLQCYFDYEALGRDMNINGTYLEDENGTLWEYVG